MQPIKSVLPFCSALPIQYTPWLRSDNRRWCGRALYAYSSLSIDKNTALAHLFFSGDDFVYSAAANWRFCV